MSGSHTVAVSGATGFIGSALVRAFGRADIRVVGLVRRIPDDRDDAISWRPFDLGAAPCAQLFDGVDTFVHAAYVPDAASERAFVQNVEGTAALLAAARAAGVVQSIFISSLAAAPGASSLYGRQKFAVERLFDRPGDAVVRPGLVIGPGGLFARMAGHVRSGGWIPLFENGTQPLQIVDIDDLCAAMLRIVQARLSGPFVVATPQAVPYRDFYARLCAELHVTPRLVAVPYAVADAALTVASALRLRLPIERDNVRGLKTMVERDSAPDLRTLGLRLAPWDVTIRKWAAMDADEDWRRAEL